MSSTPPRDAASSESVARSAGNNSVTQLATGDGQQELSPRRDTAARFFQRRLLRWSEGNLRSFPWRRTNDAFRLLIAEMMLRRTRAAQVSAVYEEFVLRYPDAGSLASADAIEVGEILRPLGLSWRVPAFIQMARQIILEHSGRVPTRRDDLLKLPGVGDYVADAVRCFAYGEAAAIVDTNTVRVAGRYFGFPVGPESRRIRGVKQAVASLLDRDRPEASNLALLDFAATVCKARVPLCLRCPMAERCHWARAESSRQTAVADRA